MACNANSNKDDDLLVDISDTQGNHNEHDSKYDG